MIICFISSVLIVLWIYFRWATREIYKALKDVPEIAPFPFIGGARIFLGKSNEGKYFLSWFAKFSNCKKKSEILYREDGYSVYINILQLLIMVIKRSRP